MTALVETSLSADERALIERFAQELHVRLDGGVHAVWLFGSRARTEKRTVESDVDVLVVVDDASWDGRMFVRSILDARKAIHLADRFLTAVEALFE